jgi:hypothetical protein
VNEATYTPIDFTIEQVPDDWEALASAGREVMQHMDTGRWLAGDIANRVTRAFGDDSLGKFAADIGIARRQTLYTYAQVSARFDDSLRGEFPALSWSHFRTAVRAKDDAELFLVQAQDNGWPVAEMARQIASAIGKSVPPVKLWEGEGVIIIEADQGTSIALHGTVPAEVRYYRRLVTVKVYEAGAE